MKNEKIYEVYWQGPYKPKNIEKKIKQKDFEKYVLYSIYGSHPVYGDNVLLYIGMTEQGVNNRLIQHDYWMDEERYGPSKIYVASIGDFKSWEESNNHSIFNKPDRKLIEKIESLLIYAHQPSQNKKNKNSADNSHGIRIFNTGQFGSLMPEISCLYQYCGHEI